MSTSRSPVGPLPAKVYWRRRLVVGLGLLAVLVAIILIVVRPGQGAATPPSGPPATSPAAESAESAEPEDDAEEEPPANPDGTPPACTAGSVQVEAVMDKDDYAQDELPQLSLTLINIGSTPCLAQAGTDVQEYRITSGSDLIWSSRDCQEDQQRAEVVLEPGKAVSTPPFEWSRERSDPTTCDGERATAVGGGATYVVQVTVGDFESDTNRFVLL